MKKTNNVQFHKSGNGNISARIGIPVSWLTELGIDVNNRNVVVEKKENKIVIYKETKNQEE